MRLGSAKEMLRFNDQQFVSPLCEDMGKPIPMFDQRGCAAFVCGLLYYRRHKIQGEQFHWPRLPVKVLTSTDSLV